MIPTVILAGALTGFLPHRLPVAGACILAIVWPLFLMLSGHLDTGREIFLAGALALANAIVGILLTQGVTRAIRAVLSRYSR